MTSLAFMFDDVPEPVWKTSIGNWSSWSPRAISSAAAAIRSASVGVEQPELGVDARGGALDAAEPAHDGDGHALARDGEVGDGLGRLAAPQLLLGVLHAHRSPPVPCPEVNASARRAPERAAGSGVTSRGSSSPRQCAQTSTGSASMRRSEWRSTTGGPSLAQVLVAPAHDRDDRGIQAEPLLRQLVLEALGLVLVAAPLEDARAHEQLQPRGEDVARDAEVALHHREAPHAVEALAQDQQRPALPEDLHRAADRARRQAQACRPSRPHR